MLRVHFRRLTPDSPRMGRIICLACRDNVYHAEVECNGKFWTADATADAVICRDTIEHECNPAYWDILRIDAATVGLPEFGTQQLGKRYDWTGAFLSAINSGKYDSSRYFCSRLARDFIAFCGTPIPDISPNPGKLRADLRKLLGMGVPARATPLGMRIEAADHAYMQELVANGSIDEATRKRVMNAITGDSK